jgi:hypothetical protein
MKVPGVADGIIGKFMVVEPAAKASRVPKGIVFVAEPTAC